MPRIPKEHIDSVATVFATSNYRSKPAGTAFLMSYLDNTTYLLTCAHCKVPTVDKIVFSTGETIDFQHTAWTADPGGNDVIARDVTDDLPPEIKKCSFPYLSDRVKKLPDYLQGSAVGDEIYMLGLHTPEAQQNAITPRARFGNISAWANENEMARQGNGRHLPSHIGDMRSRPGFSGSPVYTFRERDDQNKSSEPTLLGIHCDQYKEEIIVRTHSDTLTAEIPTSMTIIVPAWTFEFIDNDPVFRAARAGRRSNFFY